MFVILKKTNMETNPLILVIVAVVIGVLLAVILISNKRDKEEYLKKLNSIDDSSEPFDEDKQTLL
jgi:hypothetical protein